MGSSDFHGNICLSSWHFPDGSIISWDRIVLVGGPLAKLLFGWFAYVWMQKHQKLSTCGICLNVVSAPSQVPMLPLLALAPVAWNLRHLQQKGQMSCKIRVFCNICLSSWHFPDGFIISWDRIVLVGGPLAKLLFGWFAYVWMQKHQKLSTCGICLNVVSAPLQVPMLPLLALAPVAWNLRHLQQKGEMSCKIRVFWPDFAQDRSDYLTFSWYI